jgi:hypothetical protein
MPTKIKKKNYKKYNVYTAKWWHMKNTMALKNKFTILKDEVYIM